MVPNWFLCTDSANDDIIIVLAPCWIPFNNFSYTPVCVSNSYHLSQLPYLLVAVVMEIPFVESMTLQATIPMR